MSLVDRRRGRAPVHGRKPARVAMGQDIHGLAARLPQGGSLDQRQAVITDRLANRSILIRDLRRASIGSPNPLGTRNIAKRCQYLIEGPAQIDRGRSGREQSPARAFDPLVRGVDTRLQADSVRGRSPDQGCSANLHLLDRPRGILHAPDGCGLEPMGKQGLIYDLDRPAVAVHPYGAVMPPVNFHIPVVPETEAAGSGPPDCMPFPGELRSRRGALPFARGCTGHTIRTSSILIPRSRPACAETPSFRDRPGRRSSRQTSAHGPAGTACRGIWKALCQRPGPPHRGVLQVRTAHRRLPARPSRASRTVLSPNSPFPRFCMAASASAITPGNSAQAVSRRPPERLCARHQSGRQQRSEAGPRGPGESLRAFHQEHAEIVLRVVQRCAQVSGRPVEVLPRGRHRPASRRARSVPRRMHPCARKSRQSRTSAMRHQGPARVSPPARTRNPPGRA